MDMRRWVVTAALAATGLALWPTAAASQEEPTTTTTERSTTTTTEAPTTTTEATTTTTEATTTTLPAVTTTTTPAQVALFGELITDGTLGVDVTWLDEDLTGCSATVPLGGGQMNRLNDADGYLGLVYGQAPTRTGNTAVLMMELGVLPYGVGVLSTTDNGCNLDAIGVGAIVRGEGFLSVRGIGIGATPDSNRAEAVRTLDLVANVAASGGPANLDVPSLYEFLVRPRPSNVPPES